MLNIVITSPDGKVRRIEAPPECTVGKGANCEVRLTGWKVGKEHARFVQTPQGVLLEDAGAFAGVKVNNQRILDQYGPLKASDVVDIGGYLIQLTELTDLSDLPMNDEVLERAVDNARQDRPLNNSARTQQANFDRAHSGGPSFETSAPMAPVEYLPAVIDAPSANLALEYEWRKRVHGILLETMDLRRHDVSSMSDDRLRNETRALIDQIMKDVGTEIPAELNKHLLAKQVLDEAVGLGPLEALLDDDSVSEVMVNRFDEIYVERAGRLLKYPLTFTDDRAVMGVIERIVAPLGRRIDESSPMVDARLKDGSRVNAIIPPLALKGPTLTIRKFAKKKLQASDLVNFGSISQSMADFLRICVEQRKNVIVSGGTGSGKTTLLNILSNFIPATERIITVEDAAELKLNHAHLISLESRPTNVEGRGGVSIRELVKNTLRMRPDRIVVGECRGAEALDMLQAMNTGHDGSLTTLHANSPRDALARLETLVLMAGMDLPVSAIREQTASAIDIIVQQTRFACGTRMVTHISEVSGIESGTVQLQDLFKFVNRGYEIQGGNSVGKVRGYFTGCDMVPEFYEELRASGMHLDLSLFKQVSPLQDEV